MKKILVIGSLNIDMVMNVKKMPVAGETIIADQFSLIPGGKGANQACAIGKLGGDVTMLGAVGDDETGRILTDNLADAGVDVSHIKREKDARTGTAIITVNEEGNNSIIVIAGANHKVDKSYIDSKIDLIQASDIVIFQLEIPLETVVYAAQKAKEMGKYVILDPAPARQDIPQELYSCLDLIKPNEIELGMLLGMDTNTKDDLEAQAIQLKSKGIDNVLVTMGGDGAFLAAENNEISRYPTMDVKVVDTTAAGDSFTAGVAVSLAKGEDLASAIRFADKVATIVVTRKGAQSSIPSSKEVEEFVKTGVL